MRRDIYTIILLLLIGSFYWTSSATSTYSNGTQTALEEDDDDDLTESDVAEFKARVRRLIPYMIYGTVNNGVSQEYKSPPKAAPPKTQYYLIHKEIPETKSFTKQGTTPRKLNYKFVPSVQYNPKEDGIDGDHFIPIRYGSRLPSSQSSFRKIPENYEYYDEDPLYTKYQSPVRPLQQEPEKEHNYPAPKTILKLVPARLPEYGSDYYDSRPLIKVNKVAPVAPPKEYDPLLDANFESNRYITPDYPRQKPVLVPKATTQNSVKLPIKLSNLGHILKSLRLTNRLPENLNRENIDSSIATLIEILDILNGNHNGKSKLNTATKNNEFKGQYQKPQVITQTNYEATQNPSLEGGRHGQPQLNKYEIKDRPKYVTISANKNQYPNKVVEYYVPITQDVNVASGYANVPNTEKHIPQRPAVPSNIKESDEYSYDINNTDDDTLEEDRFTLPIPESEPVTPSLEQQKHSDDVPGLSHAGVLPPPSFKYGATRGKPHIDYPAYSKIPETNFNCKKQRYKGFFGDPSTGCQIWHYCDLNGGKSSFLCPNGTIFSQIALTCDWWFNVKCESTTQLYVLNERLYKYILPIMPKFPEDFTGPEVDRYLEFKFKEMEEKLKEKKKKKQEKQKMKLKPQSIESKDDDL